MTIYETQFGEQLGASSEVYNVTIEYCDDFTGDGFDDIKVTISLDEESNSGSEDMIGVAFDIQNNAVAGLSIVDIDNSNTLDPNNSSDYVPTSVIGANQVSDSGPLDPGFNTSGGGSDEPYDVGIKVSDQGSGDGIVQSMSFVITGGATDLDAEALLENTDWWVRTQSTDGGAESAKTGGFILDLPPCGDEPPPPPDFSVDKAISNIVIYADRDGEAGDVVTKIKFDAFDELDCDDDGEADELFDLTLAQLEDALAAVGAGDCKILGVTIKAGKNGGEFGPGEGQFFDADLDDDFETGTTAKADVEYDAADYAEIWC